MGLVHSPKIVTDGLVLALDAGNVKSYPGSGTTWYDKSGNGNNGILTNGPTFASGSIVFDGVDDYVNLGISPTTLLEGTIPTTISAWFRTDIQSQQMIFGNGNSSRFYIEVFNNSGTFVAHWGFGDTQNSLTSQAIITVGEWYNYTATYDGNVAKGYLNGNNTDTQTIGTKSYAGNMQIGNYGLDGLWFNGDIATLLTYNRTLTSQEILQNYNATKGRFGL